MAATLARLDSSALSLGADLFSFVTYDDRQEVAARRVGLPVAKP